ncbi:MAG: hypothetical protein JO000_20915 [Alphaproteobacteria bacterium]|nr:hypothetical protein [Alphaproteobacteria bacterium]
MTIPLDAAGQYPPVYGSAHGDDDQRLLAAPALWINIKLVKPRFEKNLKANHGKEGQAARPAPRREISR